MEVDVLLGGGLRHFYPNGKADTIKDASGTPILNNGTVVTQGGRRTDMVDLVGMAKDRGYVYINSRDALLNLDTTQFTPGSDKKLLGLFNSSHLNYEQDRQLNAVWEPSLPEMVEIAIKVLKAKGGKKGFFLMVEGGRIDHLEHANEGGITVVAGSPNNQYTVDSDKPVYAGGGEANYSATPTTPRVPGLYGSDYLLKEVLAFDYAVAQGRKLLDESATSNTLIFSTSDHECGGTAIVGLHDASDAQANGTMIRTYALGPKQKGVNASSSGAATATTWATPVYLERGDIDFGAKNPSGWYPDYTTYTFQGRPELWPKADTNGRRIVIAFGSNPLTNGNSTKAGGTPGNHTPMDIWVGADINVPNGDLYFAKQFIGKGLIDNTSITPIMAKFLSVKYPFDAAFAPEQTAEVTELYSFETTNSFSLKTFPNPARNQVNVEFNLPSNDAYSFTLVDMKGNIVKTMAGSNEKGNKKFVINTDNFTPGIYIARLKMDGDTAQEQVSKIIIQR